MQKKYNVAIVGATGMVGEVLLSALYTRKFPVNELYPLASERSVGKTVLFGKRELNVQALATFDFGEVDIAFFSAGGDVSRQYVPIATQQGAVVIDNTSCFRYDADVPLVVPEVNPECIAHYSTRRIIANPNCSTIQMMVALKPIHDVAAIKRINVATYQAVSGTGRRALLELASQTGELLNARPIKPQVYPKQIAFNLLPHIDEFQDNGYTKEEMKMVWETQKILNDATIMVNPTAVRVPVFFGHSEAIHLELARPMLASEARSILMKAPGVKVVDDPKRLKYPTPQEHAAGHDEVYVGRIRQDISAPNGLNLWVVADNVRKGAAINAIQIAEILQKQYI